MEETILTPDGYKFTATVTCKVPLTEADMRYLERDIQRRLLETLVQKFASVEFKRG